MLAYFKELITRTKTFFRGYQYYIFCSPFLYSTQHVCLRFMELYSDRENQNKIKSRYLLVLEWIECTYWYWLTYCLYLNHTRQMYNPNEWYSIVWIMIPKVFILTLLANILASIHQAVVLTTHWVQHLILLFKVYFNSPDILSHCRAKAWYYSVEFKLRLNSDLIHRHR